ncbi:hypothetical protein KO529_02330 [Arenibacter algicola]|uniref:hypothetical protein n=1 Tax=Arenibacter algicola TaxID=616991 RepID=UPI001C074579|nr:hypothetical protein [Arenibacter algicola]MBU2903610.1 hypothetical protein [Arenibacter algicola]
MEKQTFKVVHFNESGGLGNEIECEIPADFEELNKTDIRITQILKTILDVRINCIDIFLHGGKTLEIMRFFVRDT